MMDCCDSCCNMANSPKNWQDARGRTLLWWAVSREDLELISFLLDRRLADPELGDETSRSPVGLAREMGEFRLADNMLLRAQNAG